MGIVHGYVTLPQGDFPYFFSPRTFLPTVRMILKNLRILQARRVFQAIDEDHSGFISLEDWAPGHGGIEPSAAAKISGWVW